MKLIKELTELHQSMLQESADLIDSETYDKMMDDGVIHKLEGWVSEEGWDAMDNNNVSVAIHDLMDNCDDPDMFQKYGVGDISIHKNALKLMNSVSKYGF